MRKILTFTVTLLLSPLFHTPIAYSQETIKENSGEARTLLNNYAIMYAKNKCPLDDIPTVYDFTIKAIRLYEANTSDALKQKLWDQAVTNVEKKKPLYTCDELNIMVMLTNDFLKNYNSQNGGVKQIPKPNF